MFSYSIKIRNINSPKLKAVATLVIENILEIEGFKIIDGSKGLFVAVPSHKGSVVEDGVRVDKYFDDVRFSGEQGIEFSEELKKAILAEYQNSSSASSQTSAIKAKDSQPTSSTNDSSPPRTRKPLWGF